MEQTAPVWAVFGDLMSGLLGAFVLILVGVLVVQMDLVASLEAEMAKRRRKSSAAWRWRRRWPCPLASGRVTLANGRIGISGSVLFAPELRPAAARRPAAAEKPGAAAAGVPGRARDEMLMVSGFTDDRRCAGATASSPTTWSCRPSAR
jgi:hypothetical protein